MSTSYESVHRTVADLIREVTNWPGVEVVSHRVGTTAFRVADREFGRVHDWGMLDIAFLGVLRDALLAIEATDVHRLLRKSRWTTFYIHSTAEYEQARWLLRLSYLSHVATLQRTDAAAAPDVDVEAELDRLDPVESVRAAFEGRQPATA